jgi:NADPH-ferrihemoprotein reductase
MGGLFPSTLQPPAHISFYRRLTHPQSYGATLGDSFSLITAYSRTQATKVYVQNRLREHAAEVNTLLAQRGNFYVCGDAANMAREVSIVLGQIIAEQREISIEKAEEVVKGMRSSGQYQEDVWS